MTDYPKVWLTDEGILRVDFGEHADITVETMKTVHQRHVALSRTPRPVLVTGEGALSADYYAQKFAASPEVAAVVSASAMVARSMLARHYAQAMANLHRPPFPTRLFDNEEEALDWLRGFIKESTAVS